MAGIHYISIDEARDIHLATIRNSGGGDCGELDWAAPFPPRGSHRCRNGEGTAVP